MKRKLARPAIGQSGVTGLITLTRCGRWISSRGHGRRPQSQVSERDRRTQSPLPGHPGDKALQGLRRGGGAGEAHQPLLGTGVRPTR